MTSKEKYLNYLQTEHWKGLRNAAFLLYGRKCEFCGVKHGLDIHHIQYHSLYDVEPKELTILCRKDHDLIHNFLKQHTGRKIVNREQLFAWFQERIVKEKPLSKPKPIPPKQSKKMVNINRIINYLDKLQHVSPTVERARVIGKIKAFRELHDRSYFERKDVPQFWLSKLPAIPKTKQKKGESKIKWKRKHACKRVKHHRTTLKRKSKLHQ